MLISAPEMFRHAEAVFLGKVTYINNPEQCPSLVEVSFAVEKSWKSVSSSEVTVTTNYGGKGCEGMCGYAFREGESYIVYARWNSYPLRGNESYDVFARMSGGTWHTNICSGTAELLRASEQLTDLQGRSLVEMKKQDVESEAVNRKEESSGSMNVLLVTSVAVVVSLVIGFLTILFNNRSF